MDTSARGGSVKRFKRPNGLDTKLYKTYLYFFYTHLLEAAFHRLVGEQRYGPHEVSYEDEVSLCLEVESNDAVEVATLHSQLLLSRPLKQTHLGHMTWVKTQT